MKRAILLYHRFLAVCAVCGLLLINFVVSAQADEWIGSDPIHRGSSDYATKVTFIDTVDAATISGKVIAWELFAHNTGEVTLQIFRPVQTGYQLIGQNIVHVVSTGLLQFPIPAADQISVQPGDLAAFRYNDPERGPKVISFNGGGPWRYSIPYDPPAGDITNVGIGGVLTFDHIGTEARTYSLRALISPAVSAAQSPQLFVSCGGDTSTQIMRIDGTTGLPINLFVAPGQGGVSAPEGMQFGPDGALYVCSYYTGTVKKYDGFTVQYLGDFASGGGLAGPVTLTFGPDGNLYVADYMTNGIFRYNGATGAPMPASGQSGAVFVPGGSGGLSRPFGLVFGPDNNLYVTSSSNNRVLRYNGTSGAFINTFVAPDSGGLSGPFDLTFGPDGNLYVSSSSNSRVLRYNGTTGAFINAFVPQGSGGLNNALGLTFGPDGNLYLVSHYPGSVKRYNGRTGAYLDDFVRNGAGGYSYGTYLTFRAPTTISTFSAANDFDKTNNPSLVNTFQGIPVWTLGAKNSATDPSFTPDDTPWIATISPSNAILNAWSPGGGGGTPWITHNGTGAPINYFNAFTIPDNQIMVHPNQNNQGNTPNDVCIRWTAPSNGRVHISGYFQRITGAGSTVMIDVHVAVNNVEKYSQVISGPSAPIDFTTALSTITNVQAGDKIDFVVGPNGDNTSDHTFLSAVVDFDPTQGPSPDLQVTATPPSTTVITDQAFDFSWTDTNAGEVRANSPWTDKVYLSADNQVGNDTLLTQAVINQSLDPTQSVTTTRSLSVPRSAISQEGTYYLIVVTDANSNVNEGGNEGNNTVVVPFTVHYGPIPDLQITAGSAPAETWTDRDFELSWTDTNAGALRANGPWTDRVYLSTDTQLGGDTLLGDYLYPGSLDPNQSAEPKHFLNIPLNAIPQDGTYYLLIVTDANNNVNEYEREDNNVRAVPIMVRRTLLPDLIVDDPITAPATAFDGQTIQVQWKVKNQGTGATDAPEWFDRVYLSPDINLANSVTSVGVQNVSYLNAGDSYIATANLTIPRGITGDYKIIVYADDTRVVREGNENNNNKVATIHINLSPYPDLQVPAAPGAVPDTLFAGQTVQMGWTVNNTGNSAAPALVPWYDGVYLSPTETFNSNTARLLTRIPHTGGLNVGASYTLTNQAVTIPNDIIQTADFYLLVRSDDTNQVYEFVMENNNLSSGKRIHVIATPPDLIVEESHASDNAGEANRNITVTWKVKNQGAFDALGSWFDTVYISSSSTLDINTATVLGNLHHSGTLAPAATYTASLDVKLPACQAGMYYLFVVTDRTNLVHEFGANYDAEDNNFGLPITLPITSNPPDLQVTNVTNPPDGNAGQSVPMSWTVTNTGVGATIEGSWTDAVYLSKSATFDPATAIGAGSFSRSGNLTGGANYTQTVNIAIPNTAQGTYYVFVKTDSSDVVEECDSEGNNVGVGMGTITVTNTGPEPTRPSDLQIVENSITAPVQALAGEMIAVGWTGTNAGPNPVRTAAWNDAVYFSTDTTLDNNDRRLSAVTRSGPLAIGATYNAQTAVTIPLVSAGTYYLIVKADADNYVPEGENEGNNTRYRAIPITIPDVDLTVESVDAPAEAVSGQTMPVSWMVKNTGTHATLAGSWTDYVILSRDQILDPNDRVIGYAVRDGVLEAGASYTATINASIPRGLSGPYYVFVRTDWHNAVAETNELNNVGTDTSPVIITLPPPVDLRVTSVPVPASASPGEVATFQWTVTNQGNNTVNGTWRDAVYLSKTPTWDLTATLVGRTDHNGPLPPNASYNGTFTGELPAVEPGSYYVIIRTDVRNNVLESNEDNNTTTSASTFPVDVVELQLGVPRNSTLITNQERYYKVNMSADETLLFTLNAQGQDVTTELFARYNQIVSRSAYDFQFSNPFQASQEVVVPNTNAGWYYALARGDFIPSTPTPLPFQIKAETIPFSIRSVSPARIGDNGQVTITIKGGRFQEGATVRLFNDTDSLPASRVWLVDKATAKARFFFTNAPHGLYSVELTNPNNAVTTLADAVTIENVVGLFVTVNADGNLTPRVGRTMSANGILTNTGNVDAPYVTVFSEFTGQVTIVAQRPEGTLPHREEFPNSDWEHDVPSTIFLGGNTIHQFVVRDLEPGQRLSFSLAITQFALGEFHLGVSAFAQTELSYVSDLCDSIEALRQTYLNNPFLLSLDPSLATMIHNPDQWWHYWEAYYIQWGYIRGGVGNRLRAQEPDDCFESVSAERREAERAFAECMSQCFVDEFGRHCPDQDWESRCRAKSEQAKKAVEEHRLRCTKQKNPPCAEDRGWIPGPPIPIAGLFGINDAIASEDGCGVATRPSDPNDKIGPTGFGPQAFVGVQQPLPYTIDFENVSTATAAAQRVTITDQLDTNLDWRTFRLKEIGFGKYRISVPENRAFFQTRLQLGEDLGNLVADIVAGINVATGEVFWTLTAIDPRTGEQPNSALLGLLPPNDETGRGQGFVSYTIQPRTDLITGATIANSATIIFDTEEPIITNSVLNTVDAVTPSSMVAPLPATTQTPTFLVSWSGTDDANGSGVQSYDVYVSVDGSPYQPWLTGTTETSTEFTDTENGATYRFYSRARGNAGNIEPAPTVPDAETTVLMGVGTITGRIDLEDCENRAQQVTFSFRRPNGQARFSRTVTLNANGQYTLTNIPANSYQLAIKGSKWLRTTQPITLSDGQTLTINATLLAADANNDNIVDVNDLADLIAAFDADPSSPNWNGGVADFDCNDIVDVEDLDLLIRNFDKSGDP